MVFKTAISLVLESVVRSTPNAEDAVDNTDSAVLILNRCAIVLDRGESKKAIKKNLGSGC